VAILLVLGSFSSLTAQDKKLTPVNVGYSAISGSFAPLWVGFDQGLFTKYGLDLKMAYIQGNRVMMSALTAGEIQLYQGGAEGLIRLVSGGGDGIFVATQYNFVGHYVLMTDPSIGQLEDLRGKRIALFRSSLASVMAEDVPILSLDFCAVFSWRVVCRVFVGIVSCNDSLGHAPTKGATDERLVHGSGTDWNLDGAV
jgi:ABC-type nitrate/sulfonate/bicarbonate transport system substrate-binding protein